MTHYNISRSYSAHLRSLFYAMATESVDPTPVSV